MSAATTATVFNPQTDAGPHPSLVIYNTLSKKKEPFATVRQGQVGVYLCGPTVYGKAHIGHMVGPVLFDTIKRYLTYSGYEVRWVVNITDVDDKLIKAADEQGISMAEVAELNIKDYEDNLAALGVTQIDDFPKATECMGEIIDFIAGLIDEGYAYESQGDVYFDVAKDADYGKLSNRTVTEMQGDGGGAAARKRSAADFALWKSAKTGEPSWDSPWGAGRPGWHIECSAMSKKLLGETFDIHGGGLDLVFPHHENEIAQSESCHGKPMVKYWAHNGLLRKDAAAGKIGGRAERQGADREAGADDAGGSNDAGGKMSRSKGAGGLADLIAKQGGERIRFFLLRTHYRSTVLFSEEAIEEAAVGLETFYRLFKRYERVTGKSFYDLKPATIRAGVAANDAAAAAKQKFVAAMDDDFNTGSAIGELFELARLTNKFCEDNKLESSASEADQTTLTTLMTTIKELAGILGLFLHSPASAGGGDELLGSVMQLVIELRAEARAGKNFAVADAIRDGLKPAGIVVEDRPSGAEWSGGDTASLEAVMQMLIALRASSRAAKDFATADALRDKLAAIGVTIEDRAGGAEWSHT
ncbi:cysteine--tRNA ligase [Botrimarina hoheduenensis]|nr:cysteine--tRNA ligase [Botrimarina hoheduenensis]